MADTFELIASSIIGSGGAASIDFNTIPSTFTDLCIKMSIRTTVPNTSSTTYLYINGVLTNRTAKIIYGTGTAKGSYNNTGGIAGDTNGGTSTSSTFGNQEIYISGYSSSNDKSYSIDAITEHNSSSTDNTLMFLGGLWSSSAVITSLSLAPSQDLFAQYSTAYLYGIKSS